MDSATITMIIISCVGFILVTLVSLVSFFALKSYNAIEANMTEHSKLISQIGLNLKELASAITSIKDHFGLKHDAVERTLKEHHEEIEMLRTRTHDASTDINWMIGEGKAHNLWSIAERPKRTFAAVRMGRDE